MSPSSASLRKHKRHSANFRMNARGRPQRWHLFRKRILNLGVFVSFAIFAVVAMSYAFLKGIPSNWSSLRDSSSVLAVVTMEIFMPRALSTFI
jgi:hypothetical protein